MLSLPSKSLSIKDFTFTCEINLPITVTLKGHEGFFLIQFEINAF